MASQGTITDLGAVGAHTPPQPSEKKKLDGAATGGVCWPDPDPCPGVGVMADDVTRMNATRVGRIFCVRCDQDIKRVLALARDEGLRVSVRGTKHSMGGHSIARDGLVIDMTKLTTVSYDPSTQQVTCGTGCLWADLIVYLNQFGMSPRTMQSYSSFSVGGTISVNGHGITTDFTLVESVVSFRLIKWDGSEVLCSREAQGEGRELFGLAIGGYGLFGVIPEVTMKVNSNAALHMDTVQLNPDEFLRYYSAVQATEDVEIKLARLNIIDVKHIQLFIFRRSHGMDEKLISKLDRNPREMTWKTRLMYKWLMPNMKEIRYALEQKSGAALDWSYENERNGMMYESAEPLARLYEPLFKVDDTFVLQEFFVPRRNFKAWLAHSKPIYSELAQNTQLILLNTTIRFVNHDKDTILNYASDPDGMFAFVLYYRLPRSPEGDEVLHKYHSKFAKITIDLQGTIYLPYRHHYTREEMERCYPGVQRFFAAKEKYDPHGVFDNLWFRAYGLQYCSKDYQAQVQCARQDSEACPRRALRAGDDVELLVSSEWQPARVIGRANGSLWLTYQKAEGGQVSIWSADSIERVRLRTQPSGPRSLELQPEKLARSAPPQVDDRRENSYRRLVNSPTLRRDFVEGFLTQIFNVLDNKVLYRMMCKVCWDPENDTDIKIYRSLQKEISTLGGPMQEATKIWKQLKQLAAQKKELARETASIVGRLGKLGHLHDYVSVGDHGKMILPLKHALGMNGKTWLVHHELSDDIPAVLERGSLDDVGTFVHWDAIDVGPFSGIPDNSADLVTMSQGLHHLPQNRIMAFLDEVVRVLRPGGLFIVREHNATEDLMPMLDLAHSIFNCVLGVTDKEEEKEIRAFRPVLEWRAIIEAAGLVDSMLYEMEQGDPTLDEMMCFYKPPLRTSMDMPDNASLQEAESLTPPSAAVPGLPPTLAAMLDQIPITIAEGLKGILDTIISEVPTVVQTLKAQAASLSEGQSLVVGQVIEQLFMPIVQLAQRFRPYFDAVEVQSAEVGLGSLIPQELFLLIPTLLRKAERGQASVNELFAVAVIKDLQAAFSGDTSKSDQDTRSRSTSEAFEVDDGGPAVSASEIEDALRKLCQVFPQFANPSIIAQIGLSRRAQAAAWAQLDKQGELNVTSMAKQLEEYLDAQAWQEFSVALNEAKIANKPLSADELFARSGDNPWSRAFMALLASPRVRFTDTAIMGLKLSGLSDVVRMWQLAQSMRRSQRSSGGPPVLSRSSSQRACMSKIQAALQAGMNSDVKEVTMVDGQFFDVPNVSQVLMATYGYKSLTASPKNVTVEVQRRYLRDGTLKLQGRNLTEDLLQRDPIEGGLDNLRKVVAGKQNVLTLRFRISDDPDPDIFMPYVNTLLDRLCLHRFTPKLHSDDGEYTWYKLNEWMQVEMCQIFGHNLEHTSWYRFPYMEFLKTYFDVLLKEAQIVKKIHGEKKALMSMAFISSLVPGIVMAFLFGQLKLLSLPILMAWGEDYDDDQQSRLYEQLVVQLTKEPNWQKVDKRIEVQDRVVDGLLVLKVPTFKALTEVLCNMARKLPTARVLEISNQRHIQVKVLLQDPDTQLRQLAQLKGCEVMFTYKFATDGTQNNPRTQASLCVMVPYLLSVLRACARQGVLVDQVYDFFC